MQAKRSTLLRFFAINGYRADEQFQVTYGKSCFAGTTVGKAREFTSLLYEGEVSIEFVELIRSKCNLAFLKDQRAVLNYGLELALGWLVEDFVLSGMRNCGLDIKLNGTDGDREFLNLADISAKPDFRLRISDISAEIELVKSYDFYWQKSGVLDLRHSKFDQLASGAHKAILAIELSSNRWFCAPMSELKNEFRVRPNPAWGGKSVATLPIGDRFTDLSADTMAGTLRSLFSVEIGPDTVRDGARKWRGHGISDL